MKSREKRTRKVTIRFTLKEYGSIESNFNKTTSSQLSHYMRQVLLSRPVVIKYRNESLDQGMEELIRLKQELNAIGNNLNQAVRKLYTLGQIPEFRHWIGQFQTFQQELQLRTTLIEQRISQMSEIWLQG